MKKFILLVLFVLALALIGAQSSFAEGESGSEDCCCPDGRWPDSDGNC